MDGFSLILFCLNTASLCEVTTPLFQDESTFLPGIKQLLGTERLENLFWGKLKINVFSTLKNCNNFPKVGAC